MTGVENLGPENGGPTAGTCVLQLEYAWLCSCKTQL